jgi:hypothetical protein
MRVRMRGAPADGPPGSSSHEGVRVRGSKRWSLAAAALASVVICAGGACDRRPPPLASCDDDLRGVYVADGRRWMILDDGGKLEAYPLFPDVTPVPELEVAPRVIGLERTEAGITGQVRRRYMRGSHACVAKVPARITACSGDTLQLVLDEPAPPLAWPAAPEQPCTWSQARAHVERWIRE